MDVLGVVKKFSGDILGSGAGEKLVEESVLNCLGRVAMRPDQRDVSKLAVLTSKAVRDECNSIVDQTERGLEAIAVGAD